MCAKRVQPSGSDVVPHFVRHHRSERIPADDVGRASSDLVATQIRPQIRWVSWAQAVGSVAKAYTRLLLSWPRAGRLGSYLGFQFRRSKTRLRIRRPLSSSTITRPHIRTNTPSSTSTLVIVWNTQAMTSLAKEPATGSLSAVESLPHSPVTTSSPNSKANGGLNMPDFAQIGTRAFWLGDYVSSSLPPPVWGNWYLTIQMSDRSRGELCSFDQPV